MANGKIIAAGLLTTLTGFALIAFLQPFYPNNDLASLFMPAGMMLIGIVVLVKGVSSQ